MHQCFEIIGRRILRLCSFGKRWSRVCAVLGNSISVSRSLAVGFYLYVVLGNFIKGWSRVQELINPKWHSHNSNKAVMMKIISILSLVVALAADTHATAIEGGKLDFPEQQLGSEANGSAKLGPLGKFDAVFNYTNPTGGGTFVLTDKNGDTVSGTFNAMTSPPPPSNEAEEFDITLTADISGGTGAYSGIDGEFEAEGFADPSSLASGFPGETQLRVDGSYDLP